MLTESLTINRGLEGGRVARWESFSMYEHNDLIRQLYSELPQLCGNSILLGNSVGNSISYVMIAELMWIDGLSYTEGEIRIPRDWVFKYMPFM